MADIFLSYNREDQDRASAFAKALEAEGFDVWWDVGLRVGEAYDEVTERALREAKAVVVLWSKKSVVSRWVRAEATLALRNKTLFPCMIEACDRPIMFELTQTADLSHWRGAGDDPAWRVFLADLKRFVDGGGAPAEVTAADRLTARLPIAAGGFKLDRRTAIIAGGASLVAGAVAFALLRPRAPSLAENGVAVLPFRNLSGDASQDYLSAGLSSEIRSVLARNAALRVVAQASCEAVRRQALGAIEMAKTLSVSFLLDGNVALIGERVKIAAELIDGKTGFSKWSQSFDYSMAELSRIQDAIAAQVASELSIDTAPSKTDGYGATNNAEAFAAYLKGNELYYVSASHETDLVALERFDHAISLDPNFGAAHAARATSLTTLGNFSESVADAQQYYEGALESARRAVALAPSSADAHSTLGFVLFQAQLRVKDAREPFDRSYELGRGVASALARFALYAAATKRTSEAIAAINRAITLDPLNATIHRALGFVHYASGQFGEAIEPVKTALALNPKLTDSHVRIAAALIALDRPEEALVAAQQERNALVRFPIVAIAENMLGDNAAAEEAMVELKRVYGDAGLYQQAQVLARWGRSDEAMAVLARAKELGDSGLTYAFIDPALDSLRSREDFNQLLKALGFL